MTELSALNVRINGDASGLTAAATSATSALGKVGAAAAKANTSAGAASVGMGKLGQAANGAGVGVQQFGWQFSQMSQSIAAGMPPINAITMQLGDLLPMLGVGGLAGVAVTAAAVMIPLAGAFLQNADNASALTKGIEELAEATEHFKIVADSIRLGVDQEEVLLVRELNAQQARLNELNAQWQSTDSLGARQRIAEEAQAIKATISELQKQLQEYRNARDEAQRLKEEQDNIKKAAEAAATATSRIGSAAAGALGQVQALGKAMWDVAAAAAARINAERQLEGMKREFTPGGQAQIKYGGRGAPTAEQRGLDDRNTMYGVPDVKTPSVGGGGGGGGGINPIIADLQSVRDALMSQEQVQTESYMRQQETLRSALEQRLLTQQEYNALMEQAQTQHQEAMAQIDAYRYGDAALQFETFMGDMASALSSGNDKMLKAARVFGAMEAGINAWRAYSQTLADPTLPFYAKFAAAAKVLAAGLGAVNAIKGGGGGGGRSGSGATSAGATEAPQQVMLNTYGGGDFIRGADFGMMLDKLNAEAGDRGYKLMWNPS